MQDDVTRWHCPCVGSNYWIISFSELPWVYVQSLGPRVLDLKQRYKSQSVYKSLCWVRCSTAVFECYKPGNMDSFHGSSEKVSVSLQQRALAQNPLFLFCPWQESGEAWLCGVGWLWHFLCHGSAGSGQGGRMLIPSEHTWLAAASARWGISTGDRGFSPVKWNVTRN